MVHAQGPVKRRNRTGVRLADLPGLNRSLTIHRVRLPPQYISKTGESALTKLRQIIILIFAASLTLTVRSIRADEPSAISGELLARARKLEVLRTGTAPFLLQADIAASLNDKKIPGNYKLLWWGPSRWQEATVLGDFRRMRDGVTDGYWQLRPLDYQPLMVFDLERLLDIPSLLEVRPRDTVRKARMRKIAGVSLSCVQIDNEGVLARELCFDNGTGLLVHAEIAETPQPNSDRIVLDYSNPTSISTNQFPSKLRLQRGKSLSIEVTVGSLQAASGIQPPPPMSGSEHFEFWRSCEDMIPAILENKTAPQILDPLKRTPIRGTVSLYAQIEPDGSLSHIKTLYSASSVLERAAVDAVQRWHYKPAACQGTSVRAETVIELRFDAP